MGATVLVVITDNYKQLKMKQENCSVISHMKDTTYASL